MITIVVLSILTAAAAGGFVALGMWSGRSTREIDYTPTHEPDARLRRSAQAANQATIGFITGSQ